MKTNMKKSYVSPQTVMQHMQSMQIMSVSYGVDSTTPIENMEGE